MINQGLKTEFASPERLTDVEIRSEVKQIDNIPMIHGFMDLIPDVFLILNKERQIVYSNKTLLKALGIKEADMIYGMRPGEAVDCIHSHENEFPLKVSASYMIRSKKLSYVVPEARLLIPKLKLQTVWSCQERGQMNLLTSFTMKLSSAYYSHVL